MPVMRLTQTVIEPAWASARSLPSPSGCDVVPPDRSASAAPGRIRAAPDAMIPPTSFLTTERRDRGASKTLSIRRDPACFPRFSDTGNPSLVLDEIQICPRQILLRSGGDKSVRKSHRGLRRQSDAATENSGASRSVKLAMSASGPTSSSSSPASITSR